MQIQIPASFWDDHSDRCPADDPENDMCIEVSRKANRVTVECNDRQLETLRSDAAFYCHRDGPDEAPRFVKDGAKRTLAAIAKQTKLIGGCIDGGACHHRCRVAEGCFRKACCVPLTSSGLNDKWEAA